MQSWNEFAQGLSFFIYLGLGIFMWASSYLSATRLDLLGQVHFFSFFPHVLTKHWCSSWEGEAGKGGWGVQVGQRGFGG